MRALGVAAMLAAAFSSAPGRAQTRTVTDEEVMKVHRSMLLIDSHNDIPI